MDDETRQAFAGIQESLDEMRETIAGAQESMNEMRYEMNQNLKNVDDRFETIDKKMDDGFDRIEKSMDYGFGKLLAPDEWPPPRPTAM